MIKELEKCDFCEEEILPGEKPPHAPLVRMHNECMLRNILGSVAHHQQKCSCFGGTENDPAGVSRRDAARLAVIEFARHSGNSMLAGWPIMKRVHLRPTNFNELSAEERWAIDRTLHLLDWDGKEGLQ